MDNRIDISTFRCLMMKSQRELSSPLLSNLQNTDAKMIPLLVSVANPIMAKGKVKISSKVTRTLTAHSSRYLFHESGLSSAKAKEKVKESWIDMFQNIHLSRGRIYK